MEGAAKRVESSLGRVDILVNNAGIGGFGRPLHQLPPDAWDQILNTNLRGVYFAIRSFAPMMIRARSGHIINISSLQPEDVAHALAMLVTQSPQSFVSEIILRPTQKP